MQGNKPFASYHIAMALKYGGISFIAGSVSHGVFSGERSFLTALIGVVAFILGTWLENRDSGETGKVLFKSLLVSTLLAISLGLFTGSLQHFPDSPYRSVWAVPVGFALSLVALALMQSEGFSRAFKRYALVSMTVVLVGSAGAYQYYNANPLPVHEHVADKAGGHDHATPATHDHGTVPVIGEPGKPDEVSRTVTVEMSDTMRFSPENLEVKHGETLRLVVKNTGKIRHELTLGTIDDLKAHAALMLKHPNMAHKDPNMVQVEPGASGEIVWKFSQAGTIDFACLQPGHYEAGMKGKVAVLH